MKISWTVLCSTGRDVNNKKELFEYLKEDIFLAIQNFFQCTGLHSAWCGVKTTKTGKN